MSVHLKEWKNVCTFEGMEKAVHCKAIVCCRKKCVSAGNWRNPDLRISDGN